jgi:hypothetical protein
MTSWPVVLTPFYHKFHFSVQILASKMYKYLEGATTFGKMEFIIKTFAVVVFIIMPFGMKIFSITAFGVMVFGITAFGITIKHIMNYEQQ